MRIASTGRAIFAVTMIGLGIIGLVRRDFVPVWNPALLAGGWVVADSYRGRWFVIKGLSTGQPRSST